MFKKPLTQFHYQLFFQCVLAIVDPYGNSLLIDPTLLLLRYFILFFQFHPISALVKQNQEESTSDYHLNQPKLRYRRWKETVEIRELQIFRVFLLKSYFC